MPTPTPRMAAEPRATSAGFPSSSTHADESVPILVFDGHCNLCNGLVRFILRNESEPELRFATATGEAGKALCKASGITDAPTMTFVLREQGVFLDRSDAAFALCRHLKAPWRWVSYLSAVPRALRDGVYNLVARNRYRLFGRRQTCALPDEAVQFRFLE